MRVERERRDGALSPCFGLAEALGGWLHARGAARDDDGARPLRDGSSAPRAATNAT